MELDTTRPSSQAYLTLQEAADYLKVSKDTISDACASGELKRSKLGHRTVRFRREWLDAWVETRCRSAR